MGTWFFTETLKVQIKKKNAAPLGNRAGGVHLEKNEALSLSLSIPKTQCPVDQKKSQCKVKNPESARTESRK